MRPFNETNMQHSDEVEVELFSVHEQISVLPPADILLLDQAESFYTGQRDFPDFWQKQYDVANVQTRLDYLLARNFLRISSMEETLMAEKAAVLRRTLRNHKLPTSGKKADIAQRLMGTLSEFELDVLFPHRRFLKTPLGERVVAEAPHIAYLHRHPVEGLTIHALHELLSTQTDRAWREHIWAHMESRAQLHRENEAYGSYRSMRYRMYQFLLEENKPKKAFASLAEVIYFDLSGVANGYNPLYQYVNEKYFFPYDTSIVRLSAALVREMAELKEALSLSEEMLNALLVQFFKQFKVPIQLFVEEECAAIVILELRGDIGRLRRAYELAKGRQ